MKNGWFKTIFRFNRHLFKTHRFDFDFDFIRVTPVAVFSPQNDTVFTASSALASLLRVSDDEPNVCKIIRSVFILLFPMFCLNFDRLCRIYHYWFWFGVSASFKFSRFWFVRVLLWSVIQWLIKSIIIIDVELIVQCIFISKL